MNTGPQARAPHTLRALTKGVTLAALLATAGCGVQVQNVKPAQDLAAERDRPIGSVHLGWRVYADKCAACHGIDATAGTRAPDLLVRVRDTGPRGFAERVLGRYDLDTMSRRAPGAPGPGSAQIDSALQRKDTPLAMPAWQGEPRVNAHILDLYAYLSARAEGRQGTGRPAP